MQKRPIKGLLALLLILLLLAGGGAWLLRVRREHRNQRMAAREAQRAKLGPKVFVAPVKETPITRDVTLPADARPYVQAILYAKVAGYLRDMRVDKGDIVKEGDLLAVIESPETDKVVAADKSDLLVKEQTLRRVRKLAKQRWFSVQDLEVAEAAVKISQANLARDEAIQSYERVTAPFSGKITARYADPGALIPQATGSTTGALPLVDLTDIYRLRITVFPAQDVAPFVVAGTPATIVEDARPDRKIEAKVTRTAGALDPRSRTMLTEIWLDNREYQIQPGTFLHVTLHVQVPPLATIPSASLFMRENVNMAAVVHDNRLKFVRVQPGLDDGNRVQIKSGLKAGEVVAVNVPAEISEGAQIQPVPQPATKQQAR